MKREKVAVRILGNNDMDSEEVRANLNRFIDYILTEKTISEANYKESSKNHNNDSVVSEEIIKN